MSVAIILAVIMLLITLGAAAFIMFAGTMRTTGNNAEDAASARRVLIVGIGASLLILGSHWMHLVW